MKLSVRDGIATLLVAAIAVPYVGFLLRGEMPFIKDPRGMSATAVVLGAAAFLFAGRFSNTSGIGLAEIGLAILTTAFGVLTVLLAESTVAYVLLAVLIAGIGVTWLVQMVHHSGVLGSGPLPTQLIDATLVPRRFGAVPPFPGPPAGGSGTKDPDRPPRGGACCNRGTRR